MKKIVVISPSFVPGQPAFERVKAFCSFFETKGVDYEIYQSPKSLKELIILIKYLYENDVKNIFVTMPPFRNWTLCFLPGIRTILDIRDGWSIAMRTGYGGTAKPNIIKAWIARIVEQWAIRSSALTVTCTPGLERYHATRWTRGKLTLIPNGFPDEGVEYAQAVANKKTRSQLNFKNRIRFICAGKFAEYGSNNIDILFSVMSKRYKDFSCQIDIYTISKDKQKIVHKIAEKYINIECNVFDFVGRDEIINIIEGYDIGVVMLRDQNYEFGTKIYDYIMCGVPIFDCFVGGDLKRFFAGYFDTDYTGGDHVSRFSRIAMISGSAELRHLVEAVE